MRFLVRPRLRRHPRSASTRLRRHQPRRKHARDGTFGPHPPDQGDIEPGKGDLYGGFNGIGEGTQDVSDFYTVDDLRVENNHADEGSRAYNDRSEDETAVVMGASREERDEGDLQPRVADGRRDARQ
mmetsp:Transcript_183531/g.582170  ORF Transcript_183531/g.582170 Transcript_183531/m.582170 type:complete len:127 (-) Transcript_183531:120-500(-)